MNTITMSTDEGKFIIKIYDSNRQKKCYMFVDSEGERFQLVDNKIEASILSKKEAEDIHRRCFVDSLHFELHGITGIIVPLRTIEKVFLTKDVHNQLNELATSENYIMWVGIIEKPEKEDVVRIKKLIIPEQSNNKITSEISPEVMGEIMLNNLNEMDDCYCFGVFRGVGKACLSLSEKQNFVHLSENYTLIGCIGDKDGNLHFSVWEDREKTGDISWEVE